MLSKRQVLSVLFFCSVVSFLYQSTNPDFYHNGHYYSDREVFRMIEAKDERGFNDWLRTLPDVNIRNFDGQTPLVVAARLQHRTFVQRLLDAGANRYLVDRWGKTARDYALEVEKPYGCNQSCSSSSSTAADVVGAVVAGAAVGVCAYALYSLLSDDCDTSVAVIPVPVAYPSYSYYNSDSYYNRCSVCRGYIGYTCDPLSIYCSTCYKKYQQRPYQSSCNSCSYSRVSDLL